jgi:hypothetical protein
MQRLAKANTKPLHEEKPSHDGETDSAQNQHSGKEAENGDGAK